MPEEVLQEEECFHLIGGNKIDVLKANHPHDKLEIKGSRAVWPEALSAYAVKLAADSENPQEVATVIPEKKRMLEDIFWAMNRISSKTEVTEKVENGMIYTVEGSSGDTCRERMYPLRCYEILGYGLLKL